MSHLHVIPGKVFTMLVLITICSTVITMPALKWWLFSSSRPAEPSVALTGLVFGLGLTGTGVAYVLY